MIIFGGSIFMHWNDLKQFFKAMHNIIVPNTFPYIQAGQAGGFGDV